MNWDECHESDCMRFWILRISTSGTRLYIHLASVLENLTLLMVETGTVGWLCEMSAMEADRFQISPIPCLGSCIYLVQEFFVYATRCIPSVMSMLRFRLPWSSSLKVHARKDFYNPTSSGRLQSNNLSDSSPMMLDILFKRGWTIPFIMKKVCNEIR